MLGRTILGFVRRLMTLAAKVFYAKTFDVNSHSVIIPEYTYSPWLADAEFEKIWRVGQKNTLLDVYRAYGLWQAVECVTGLDGDIVEVGVWRGGSGCVLAQRASLSGLDATVYLCDTFAGVVKASERDAVFRGGELSGTTPEHVEALMASLGLANTKVVVGTFPDESGDLVQTDHVRLCHIDVDVYLSTKDVFEWAWPKMPVGGIVIFDDYGHVHCSSIRDYVDEHRHKSDRFVVHNLNGQGWIIKLSA